MSVGVCVCFVPYARPQFWADLHKIGLVASLYPTDGDGGRGVSERRWVRPYAAANEWRAPSGNSELATNNRIGSSAVGARIKRRRHELWKNGALVVNKNAESELPSFTLSNNRDWDPKFKNHAPFWV